MVTPPSDRATRAETLLVLGVTLKGIPYSWADTATSLYRKMFPDSELAKKIFCRRTKASYIISDGLGPHFKQCIVDELNIPFTVITVDETAISEQRCQQLDAVLRYFSPVTKGVAVEHWE
ncbi:hypothetical protein HPB49_003128 [Dermacentor silvarum]|uniref:Uncharacterized protein n=1 Tax=Dermacentor silvarum TaxID=543639 RepID=A0ACB8C729_DERSI|nr:hypothetical protein HPB49_003128 [Dermacentor silvarum]